MYIVQEVGFTQMLKQAGREGLETVRVDEQELRPFMSRYRVALQALKHRMSSNTAKQTYH